MPKTILNHAIATTRSISQAAALLACRARLVDGFRSAVKVFDKSHPKRNGSSVGNPLFSFEDDTLDGVPVASLQRAWEDGEHDRLIDEDLDRLANHSDPHVQEIAERIRANIPHAMMRFMHAGFANQVELHRSLVAGEGVVEIVRGRKTLIFDEQPSESVRKRFNLR